MTRPFSDRLRRTSLLALALALALASGTARASCWTAQEKSIWATDEMEGVITLSFRDAVSCKPVGKAKVVIGKQEFDTDAAGLVRLPAPTGLDDIAIPMLAGAPGYQRGKALLVFALNAPVQTRFLMSPSLNADKARFVLSWGEAPADLDLHLVGPGFHVSYQNMKNVPNEARLDRDSMRGYGPETITANRLRTDARYEVWVQNYSNDKPIARGAQVQFFLSDGTTEAIQLPATAQRWVKVAEIDRGNVSYLAQPDANGPVRR
jgi:hypothetical protein